MANSLTTPKTDIPQQGELIESFGNALQVVDDVVLKNYIPCFVLLFNFYEIVLENAQIYDKSITLIRCQVKNL